MRDKCSFTSSIISTKGRNLKPSDEAKLLFRIMLWTVFFTISSFNVCDAAQMQVRKITLAEFKVKNGNIVGLPQGSPYWPQVDRHIVTADDAGNIYVLNLWNNEMLRFDGRGKLQSKIKLQFTFTRSDYRNGALEVSGDGKRFYVYGADSPGQSALLIFDKTGRIVKQFPHDESLINFPDHRLCNSPYFLFGKGQLLYDEDFKLMREPFSGFFDSSGRYVHESRKLTKFAKDGQIIWEKRFEKDFVIIGLDGNSNLYLVGTLRKGDPYSLYHLNPKGNLLSQTPIPNPFPFKTAEEKNEWEMHASEEPLSFFRLACDGSVYVIYQLSDLPKRTFERWSKGGQYFIYKFESAK
ncbi:MAG: hypothetical protein EPN25_14225 [Nitrospirae bacterium]|nr:MAG: hypothetical protein EPN25_14225 [Nitrospirota bacterium]